MKITLLPSAADDLVQAAAFYQKTASPVVAAKFVGEFKRVAHLLLEFAAIGSSRTGGRRGFSPRLFPYTVIYRQTKDGITGLVVKHDRRHPTFGGKRRW
jgi:toxin ParE1/3/4